MHRYCAWSSGPAAMSRSGRAAAVPRRPSNCPQPRSLHRVRSPSRCALRHRDVSYRAADVDGGFDRPPVSCRPIGRRGLRRSQHRYDRPRPPMRPGRSTARRPSVGRPLRDRASAWRLRRRPRSHRCRQRRERRRSARAPPASGRVGQRRQQQRPHDVATAPRPMPDVQASPRRNSRSTRRRAIATAPRRHLSSSSRDPPMLQPARNGCTATAMP